MIRIRPAQRLDAAELAPKLRQGDVQEVLASSGLSGEEALEKSLSLSKHAWAVTYDDSVEALFGVAPHQHDPDFGVIWWLSSEKPLEKPYVFVRRSWQHIAKIQARYPLVGNMVDARNTKSIRWLEHLGFQRVSTEPEWGHAKIPFHLYIRGNHHV